MAENVGGIFWTAEMRTESLVRSQKDINRATDRAGRGFMGLSRKVDGARSSLFSFSNVARAVTAVLAARQVIRYADAYTNVQNKLKVVTDNTQQLIDVQGKLLNIANETRSSLDATATLYSRTARATQELGISQERLLGIVDTINKSFAVSGATAEEASNAIRQLSQGLASGALRGEEFNSVAEQAPEILRAVSAETGMAVGELREFAAEGGITAELLIRSLENYGDTVDAVFSKSTRTFEQSLTVANNNLTTFIGKANQSAGALGLLGDIIVDASERLDDFDSAARGALEFIIKAGAFVGDAFRGIELGLLSAELAFNTAKQVALSFAVAVQKAFINIERSVVANLNSIIEKYNSLPFLEDIPRIEFDTSEIPSLRGELDEANQAVADTRVELVRMANQPLPTDNADAYLENLKVKAKEASSAINNVGVGAGGSIAAGDGAGDGAGEKSKQQLAGRIEGVGQTDEQRREDKYAEDVLALTEARNAQVIAEQEYQERITELQRQYSDERKRIQDEENQKRIAGYAGVVSSLGGLTSNLASVLKDSEGEQSSAYKAMFALSKGFAIAQASLNLSLALSQALADPSALTLPQKLANYAAIASSAGALVSSISGASYGGGRLNGGPVASNTLYEVNEDGNPEMLESAGRQYLMMGRQGGKVISNKDMQSGQGGGSSVMVNVNNYGGEKVQVKDRGFNSAQQKQIIDVFVGDMNRRGRSWNAVTTTTDAKNRTR